MSQQRCYNIRNQVQREEESGIFNIGFSELLLILLVAFLVVGPKDLPKVGRWLGRCVKKLRNLTKEIKAETGWNELEKEFQEAKSEVTEDLNQIKQYEDVTAEVKRASNEVKLSVEGIGKEVKQVHRVLDKVQRK